MSYCTVPSNALLTPPVAGADQTCVNGLAGIDGSNLAGDIVCCPVECSQCGGRDCGSSGVPNYTNMECCVNGVVHNQGKCADTGEAPCIIAAGKSEYLRIFDDETQASCRIYRKTTGLYSYA